MRTFAAVDLGAQSGRVAVGRFDGERLDVTEVHRFENVPVSEGGTLRWDVRTLYGEAVAGLRAAGDVDSIAVDSWAVDFGIVDGNGQLVQNPVHYRNARRARAMERVLAEVPARELYDRTGIQLIPINTVFELAAMVEEHDPALEAGQTLLLIPDLMHHWLCGTRTSELTNATTTQCFDPRAGRWDVDLVERLGVPSRLLPEVVGPGTPIGDYEGATVVAVGTHDTASAVAAVPFRRPGSAFVSAGTWSLVGVEVDRPWIDDATFAANLTNEGGVAGTTRLLRNVTGLWLVHECRRQWGAKYSFEELVALAEDAPAHGPLIEPNDPAFVEPGDMPARIRAFCARTGQAEPVEPGAVVRCILESLALKHAQVVDLLGDITGSAPGEIHVVGGGARNELLCRWTADASGLPVLAGPEEATTIGNLLVQAIALGELESLEDAREVVRASFEPTIYEPAADWREARARFDELLAVSA
jgi:rhamnulokinase